MIRTDPRHRHLYLSSLAGDFLTCLIAGSLFYTLATWHIEFATFNGEYTPAFPDSFYHATRILHSIETGGMLQFDPRIHAPEGSWITWPWGYDWFIARLTEFVSSITGMGLMKVMVHIPPAWGFVNISLLILLSRALSIPLAYRVVVVFCFALLPLNQQLHLVGRLDHHFMELTMVLLSAWLAISWFCKPDSRHYSLMLGTILGFSTTIHNSLFILQAPVIISLVIAWLLAVPLPSTVTYFSISLVCTTLILLLPSEPFLAGFFEYYYHSSFHLYMAFCVALYAYLLGKLERNKKSIVILSILGLMLLVPLGKSIAGGYGFISGSWDYLSSISEVQSFLAFYPSQRIGIYEAIANYSAFILLLPVILVVIIYVASRHKTVANIFIATFSVMMIVLVLKQMRFHYFGSFILYMSVAVMIHRVNLSQFNDHVKLMIFVLLLLLAYWIPAGTLFKKQGDSPVFNATYWASQQLRDSCHKDPGIILAPAEVGHYLTYFTECSVIANSFIMAPDDFRSLSKTDRLMDMSAQELVQKDKLIKYVFLLREDNYYADLSTQEVERLNPHLVRDLLLTKITPPEYEPLFEMKYQQPGKSVVFARAFKIAQQETISE